jgi:hypothetical protein
MCLWVISSVGRASPLQGEGRQFEPVITHHILLNNLFVKKYLNKIYIKSLISKFLLKKSSHRYGGVAQLVRALACHARGRGFKSRHSRHIFISINLFFLRV